MTFVQNLLSATVARPAQLGGLGLHEWAMVHGIPADDVRHAGWPLRLGSGGTDAVVERHGIRCSHFDAYRFFTDSARPRNALRPSRESQVAMEQPGCLHAGMDLHECTISGMSVHSELTGLARLTSKLGSRAQPNRHRGAGSPSLAPCRLREAPRLRSRPR